MNKKNETREVVTTVIEETYFHANNGGLILGLSSREGGYFLYSEYTHLGAKGPRCEIPLLSKDMIQTIKTILSHKDLETLDED